MSNWKIELGSVVLVRYQGGKRINDRALRSNMGEQVDARADECCVSDCPLTANRVWSTPLHLRYESIDFSRQKPLEIWQVTIETSNWRVLKPEQYCSMWNISIFILWADLFFDYSCKLKEKKIGKMNALAFFAAVFLLASVKAGKSVRD